LPAVLAISKGSPNWIKLGRFPSALNALLEHFVGHELDARRKARGVVIRLLEAAL
jgi:hypothetical protein